MKRFLLDLLNPAGRFLTVLYLIGSACLNSSAATFVWTNTVGGNWSEAMNWVPHQVPGQADATNSTDDVVIGAVAYSYPLVMFDVGSRTSFWSVRTLTVGDGGFANAILAINNGTTLQASNIIINAGSGLDNSLSGIGGALTVAKDGQLDSHSGIYHGPVTISGNASVAGDQFRQLVTVNHGATITVTDMSASGGFDLNGTMRFQAGILALAAPMTNSGTLTFFNTSYGGNGISLYNDGTTNFRGGLVNLPGAAINLNNAYYHGIQGFFGDEYFINQGVITCTNSGTINVPFFDNSAGVITNWSGDLQIGQFATSFPGTYFAADNGVIQFEGGTAGAPLTPGGDMSFNGPGAYQFINGWLLLTNDVIPKLQLAWGVLELGPDFQGGAITNLTIGSTWLTNLSLPIAGTLSVNGSTASVYGNCKVMDGGLLSVDGGRFYGPVQVTAGGTFAVTAAELMEGSPLETSGTLNVLGFLDAHEPMTNSGTMTLSSNAMIHLYNDGTTNQRASLLNLANGTIRLDGNNQVSDIWPNGQFVNQGDITSFGLNTINAAGFTNAGAITSQAGALNLNKITLEPSGSLNVGLNNASDYGKLSIGGNAALDGTFGVHFNNGFVPSLDDAFTVLTYGSYSGAFTGFDLPASFNWQRIYAASSFTLVPRHEFTLAPLGSNLVLNVTSNPGRQFTLLASTNVTQPLTQWTPLLTNTLDASCFFSVTNAVETMKPQRFFILGYP